MLKSISLFIKLTNSYIIMKIKKIVLDILKNYEIYVGKGIMINFYNFK